VTRYPEGFSHFVTSMTAPVASGWSGWPGGICTHWKAPPSHGARKERAFLDGLARTKSTCLQTLLVGAKNKKSGRRFDRENE
jgi:hypothetical protein